MTKRTAVNGTPFTDEDIERWAAEDESEEGYTGAHLGLSRPGRPVNSSTYSDADGQPHVFTSHQSPKE